MKRYDCASLMARRAFVSIAGAVAVGVEASVFPQATARINRANAVNNEITLGTEVLR